MGTELCRTLFSFSSLQLFDKSRDSCLPLNWIFLWALCFSSTLVSSEQKCFWGFRVFYLAAESEPSNFKFLCMISRHPWEKTRLLVWGNDLAWWVLINIKHLNDLANKCTRYTAMHIQGDSLIYVICSVVFRRKLYWATNEAFWNVMLIFFFFCFHTNSATMLFLTLFFLLPSQWLWFIFPTIVHWEVQVQVFWSALYWYCRSFTIFEPLAGSKILHKSGKSDTAKKPQTMLKWHR